MFKVQGVGRFVAPAWESLPRLRLRMVVAEQARAGRRYGKLKAGEAGILSLRGGIASQADARKLVEEAMEIAGISGSRFEGMISKVVFVPGARASSFNLGSRVLTIRGNIGRGGIVDNVLHDYNELMALAEAVHEVVHAQRRYDYVRRHGSLRGYEKIIGRRAKDPLYSAEEVIVETAAQNHIRKIVEPRIYNERLYGRPSEADRLQKMLNESIIESDK